MSHIAHMNSPQDIGVLVQGSSIEFILLNQKVPYQLCLI